MKPLEKFYAELRELDLDIPIEKKMKLLGIGCELATKSFEDGMDKVMESQKKADEYVENLFKAI